MDLSIYLNISLKKIYFADLHLLTFQWQKIMHIHPSAGHVASMEVQAGGEGKIKRKTQIEILWYYK